ncbi:MAG: glycogen synthase GlgA [Syntrophobacteraceae bacterium]
MSQLRVLLCSSEVAPYAKTGGLADVAGALPGALKRLGCDVRVFMPLYRSVRGQIEMFAWDGYTVLTFGGYPHRVNFWEGRTADGVPIYFLERDEFFDRSHLYGSPLRGDYEDNPVRFIAFSQAANSLCQWLDWFPHILHIHDWQTALIAPYLHHLWRTDWRFDDTRTVLTIHNLGYQGMFPGSVFGLTGLPASAYSVSGLEFWGHCNFLKGGIAYSDWLTTVSPTYSREIQQMAFGRGLDGVIRDHRDRLDGILNGVDYGAWNPETDPTLPARFSGEDLSGRARCKAELIDEIQLAPECGEKPLLAMISRLDTQKGFDLLLAALPKLMSRDVGLVILGTGDLGIQEALTGHERKLAGRLRVIPRFDEALAHRIEAGSDIFLMPSRYEPCGLNQMYSLRYGCIPVVHATGGLEDSIVDLVQNPETGYGFKFNDYTPEAFLLSIRAALDLLTQPDAWRAVQERAMAQDFSWDRAARQYLDLFERIAPI